ncbi:MAG: hypothetical protein V1672_00235 [Candidatus Diapherotrites archaeon]
MSNKMINLRLGNRLIQEIDKAVKEELYENRTEFIRAILREKLKERKTEKLIQNLKKRQGEGKRLGIKDPSEEEFRKIRENTWDKLHES